MDKIINSFLWLLCFRNKNFLCLKLVLLFWLSFTIFLLLIIWSFLYWLLFMSCSSIWIRCFYYHFFYCSFLFSYCTPRIIIIWFIIFFNHFFFFFCFFYLFFFNFFTFWLFFFNLFNFCFFLFNFLLNLLLWLRIYFIYNFLFLLFY